MADFLKGRCPEIFDTFFHKKNSTWAAVEESKTVSCVSVVNDYANYAKTNKK